MRVETKMKRERKRQGLSQQAVANQTGMSKADVCRIENCRLIPYRSQAIRLSMVLGLKPAELQQPAVPEKVTA
jgi:ribosome-binding protein aMBF1 (putative translation factor)